MKMVTSDAGNVKCPQCPIFVSKARMNDHLRMKHKNSMGPVTKAPKSTLKNLEQRTGLVVTPITSTTAVFNKPKVLQGQNPNLRPLLPKVEEKMVGCQVCKKEVPANLMAYHMEQVHKGASLPAENTAATKVFLLQYLSTKN